MIFFFLLLWHDHCLAQMCLLKGTLSQVSDVAMGLLSSFLHFILLETVGEIHV